MVYKDDFVVGEGCYLLSHSVGRPLKTVEQAVADLFFRPWLAGGEPWGAWLDVVGGFRGALGRLFNVGPEGFCPQVNLSGGLSKLVMSLGRLQTGRPTVLLCEADFPSMGFVLRRALPAGSKLRFIPRACDVTDGNVWADYLTEDVDFVFVSHVFSNSGRVAPVEEIVGLAQERGVLCCVDVAQSAGVVPLDLSRIRPDFVLGSCVKWLCGGSGAGWLWVCPGRVADCLPKDVGWFSHERPFEFDIHDFRYRPGALRFWGGTPSVAPYAIAAHSVGYFAELGVSAVREHNQALVDKLIAGLDEAVVSPRERARRSGTVILHFGARQVAVVEALQRAGVQVDQRELGMRVSPHVYNDEGDMARVIDVVEGCL